MHKIYESHTTSCTLYPSNYIGEITPARAHVLTCFFSYIGNSWTHWAEHCWEPHYIVYGRSLVADKGVLLILPDGKAMHIEKKTKRIEQHK